MNLAQIDLNLLLILKQLLEEKHVSNTALTLNMSQPTVSRSLQKLRTLFADELLVRTTTGYELTAKAMTIKTTLHTVLYNLDKLIQGYQFDPQKSSSTVRFFTLADNVNLVMPQVIAQIRAQAPNMITAIDSVPQRHFYALIAGDIHFAISNQAPPIAEQNIYRLQVATQEYRLLMSRHHPLANCEISAQMLLDCQLGEVASETSLHASLDAPGSPKEKRRRSAPLRISDFSCAAAIAETSDIIFHLPSHFAEKACLGRDLISKPLPANIGNGNEAIYLFWHKRYHMDPMCIWIRSLFKNLTREQ